ISTMWREFATSRTTSLLDAFSAVGIIEIQAAAWHEGQKHQVRVSHAHTHKKPLAERLLGMSARSWKTFEPLCRETVTFWHLFSNYWQESTKRRTAGKQCSSRFRR